MVTMSVTFPIWKTIKLGTQATIEALKKDIDEKGQAISSRADAMLGKRAFTISPIETEIDLVSISAAELGFKQGVYAKYIYAKAKNLDLGLCPNEAGPQLRLQYSCQPRFEYLRVAMEPIYSAGHHVFGITRGGGSRLWLRACCGSPDDFCYGSDRWVFVLPRK